MNDEEEHHHADHYQGHRYQKLLDGGIMGALGFYLCRRGNGALMSRNPLTDICQKQRNGMIVVFRFKQFFDRASDNLIGTAIWHHIFQSITHFQPIFTISA